MDIFIDTNILLSIFELNKDFLNNLKGHRLITSTTVVDELSKKGKQGELAIKLLDLKKIEIVPYLGNLKADDAILDICVTNSYALATSDKGLKKRAKNKHLKIIDIRNKSYLNI